MNQDQKPQARCGSLKFARWLRSSLFAGLCCASAGCARQAQLSSEVQAAPQSAAAIANLPAGATRWSAHTFSPQPLALSDVDAALLQPCARVDQGLMHVAQQMAERQAQTGRLPDNDEVGYEMRVAGVPQVWPRAWAMVGETQEAQAQQALASWLGSFADGGERRCGVGRAQSAAGPVVAVVALDAIADLQPIERQSRVGSWLEVRAQLLLPAHAAEVVVLAPRGAPRSVPSSLSEGVVVARVPVDIPGPWLIQVLPSLSSGPRPATEALVFVDQAPPTGFQATSVPGEHAGENTASAPAALLEMLNAARQSERLGQLRVHAQLSQVAQEHAQAMLKAGRVAHNLGDGDPAERVARRGMLLSMTGENVARADSLVRAHRALWGSPSHRGNMLHSRFTDAGIGVARGQDGSFWVCQIFGAY